MDVSPLVTTDIVCAPSSALNTSPTTRSTLDTVVDGRPGRTIMGRLYFCVRTGTRFRLNSIQMSP